MQVLAELLQYTVPALLVLVAAYFILKLFLDKESEKRQISMRLDSQKITLPVRLQAYERLVLLLERIDPASLLVRTNHASMTAQMLQAELTQAIRSEFDHNLSQQLYVSSRSWELVRNAREETIKMINTAAMNLKPEATSADLASLILLNNMANETSVIKTALDYLKTEARNNFF